MLIFLLLWLNFFLYIFMSCCVEILWGWIVLWGAWLCCLIPDVGVIYYMFSNPMLGYNRVTIWEVNHLSDCWTVEWMRHHGSEKLAEGDCCCWAGDRVVGVSEQNFRDSWIRMVLRWMCEFAIGRKGLRMKHARIGRRQAERVRRLTTIDGDRIGY